QELHALDREHEALGRAAAEAERELNEFQSQLEAARARVADADGELRSLESRRDQAADTAQSARDGLLAMSRAAGEVESRWARGEQTRHELGTNLAHRRDEVTQSKARVAEIQAEVSGLSAGLAGLRDSEAEQRQRVAGLQNRFLALKEEIQASE